MKIFGERGIQHRRVSFVGLETSGRESRHSSSTGEQTNKPARMTGRTGNDQLSPVGCSWFWKLEVGSPETLVQQENRRTRNDQISPVGFVDWFGIVRSGVPKLQFNRRTDEQGMINFHQRVVHSFGNLRSGVPKLQFNRRTDEQGMINFHQRVVRGFGVLRARVSTF